MLGTAIGSSCIDFTKSDDAEYGTENASVVSCEIGDNMFFDAGRGFEVVLSRLERDC